MERLTNFQGLLACCIGCQTEDECYYESCGMIEAAISKLAYYEDKQEQGLLLELPVPLNSEVFVIDNGSIIPATADVMFLGVLWYEYKHEWFATRSEAEEALAKMGGANETD